MYECVYVRTCTCDINSRIAIEKAEFKNKKTLFNSKLDLNFWKKLIKFSCVRSIALVLKPGYVGK
jgi:hypothetical protein